LGERRKEKKREKNVCRRKRAGLKIMVRRLPRVLSSAIILGKIGR
jgi:hypothetical protein